ncbi:MAG: diguanylate cyclase [Magnetococcales bacterium]|nr:diguanylate cyclase [Magnetococcales bacterium]
MSHSIKILVVDDNPADSRRLVRLLKQLSGWHITCRECSTAQEATEALSSFAPDVAFTDFLLDVGTGLDLVRGLSDEMRRDCAFILLTGHGDEEVAVQSLRAGVLDYMTKSTLSAEGLEHVLRFVVQRIQDRRALRHRDAILNALTLSTETLLKSSDWRDGMSRLLTAFGRASVACRVGLLQNRMSPQGRLGAQPLFEWVEEALRSAVRHSDHPDFHYGEAENQNWTGILANGKPFFCRATEFPEPEAVWLQSMGIHASVLIPVFVDGAWWGVLRFDERSADREWSSMELDALRTAASTLGAALQREKIEELMRLQATALETAANAIFITDSQGIFLWANPAFTRITGYTRENIRDATPRILKSGHHDNAFYQDLWNTILDGHVWRGEMVDRRKDGSRYIQETTISPVRDRFGGVTRFVSVQQDITLRKELEERLRTQAEYDTLTGLPNRRLFDDRLSQAVALAGRNEAHMVLMFVDLDRFKEVNDTLGHDAGDALLREAARRIALCVRRSDTVARLGGDEFTVILHDVAHPELAQPIATKILEQLTRPFFPHGREAHISGSIGIAVFPEDGNTVESLLKCADEAMYRSKNAGRATFHFFNPALMQSAVEN